jgi:hypothetical protein
VTASETVSESELALVYAAASVSESELVSELV